MFSTYIKVIISLINIFETLASRIYFQFFSEGFRWLNNNNQKQKYESICMAVYLSAMCLCVDCMFICVDCLSECNVSVCWLYVYLHGCLSECNVSVCWLYVYLCWLFIWVQCVCVLTVCLSVLTVYPCVANQRFNYN